MTEADSRDDVVLINSKNAAMIVARADTADSFLIWIPCTIFYAFFHHKSLIIHGISRYKVFCCKIHSTVGTHKVCAFVPTFCQNACAVFSLHVVCHLH